MSQTFAVGIDIGTYQVKVVIASSSKKDQRPIILGTGHAQSRGIRHGYIINKDDMVRTLQTAISQAEKESGVAVRRAFLSIGGIGLEEYRSRAEIIVSRADGEVSEQDVKNVLEESERKIATRLTNRKVIHAIPLAYRLDGDRVLGRPAGMKGTKLEVETLFVSSLEQHVNDLIAAVEELGISVTDVMASPMAGSFVTLTKAQKIAGVVLANIGAETVSIAVFENETPISVRVFPVGSTTITHDIALGLKLSLEDAEDAKIGAQSAPLGTQKRLDEIITNRLTDIFRLIDVHLKRIGRNGLLPAGIVISGGGSGVTTIEDIAKAALKLPSRRATLTIPQPTKLKDSSWAVAYGLCIWGLRNEAQTSTLSSLRENASDAFQWFKQFLP
ncbi:MAG: cell division protein FtsA [Candidatus Pacebacteria bacterium]|nr:cell division protein FtsA [Candidatus Paceibacterota bacterium]